MSRLSHGEVVSFARELASLLRMGYHLPEALGRMKRSASAGLTAVLTAMEQKTLAGGTLSDALSAVTAFPQTFVRGLSQARDKEQTVRTLDHLADMLERDDWRRLDIVAALAYPRFLLIFGLLLFWLLFGPLCEGFLVSLFANTNIPLPLPTQVMMVVSKFATSVPGILIVTVLWLAVFFVFSGSPSASRWWPWIPVLGARIRQQDAAIWCSWMNHLLIAETPMPEAVRLSADGCMSRPFIEAMQRVAGRLDKGGSLTDALMAERALPVSAGWLVEQAENRQFPRGALQSAADCLEQSLLRRDGHELAFIEPICLVGVGAVLGIVVIGAFLPLYQLIGQLH